MVDVDAHILSHLKEELAWAVDKQLWVISAITLFKNSMSTNEVKELKIKAVSNLKQYCIRCYMALSNIFYLFQDDFYCDPSTSLSSLANQYKINNDYIFAAPGF